jgi:hypothetical protein
LCGFLIIPHVCPVHLILLNHKVAYLCVVISPAVGFSFLRTFKYVREDFNFNL